MAFAAALPGTRLVLDTCTLTDWRYQRPSTVQKVIDYTREQGEAPALTAVTVFEALHGFEKKSRGSSGLTERDRSDLRALQSLIEQSAEIAPFDARAAEICRLHFPSAQPMAAQPALVRFAYRRDCYRSWLWRRHLRLAGF